MVSNFISLGGKHCITNSLRQIFQYSGYPLSEEMIFGIASGLGFAYINLSNSPMISGRSKPFEFEQKLAKRLNVIIKCKRPKEYRIAFAKAKKLLKADEPVLIYADMAYLEYLNLEKDSHFGGHAIVLAGYDDEKEIFYVSDRDNGDCSIRTPKGDINRDFHTVRYADMEKARSSHYRPFPANCKYLEIDMGGYRDICEDVIMEAIDETCRKMLYPEAKLLGLNGIKKFSDEIRKWKAFDEAKLKRAGITNYFQISRDGGTGGGIFRNMYSRFLIEAAQVSGRKEYAEIGKEFVNISIKWDLIAEKLWNLGKTGGTALLPEISDRIEEVYKGEKKLFTELL